MATEEPFRLSTQLRLLTAGESPRGLFRILPPATRAELLLGSALVVLSLLGAGWAFKCRSDALALERDSVIVAGKVVRLWVTSGKGVHTHRVSYEYPAAPGAGAPLFRGEDKISKEQFDWLEVGGPVAVQVCRADPANRLVHGAPPRVFSSLAALAFCLSILAMLALGGIVNLGWWWICRRRRRGAHVFVIGLKNVQSTSP